MKKIIKSEHEHSSWYFRWWGLLIIIVSATGLLVAVSLSARLVLLGNTDINEIRSQVKSEFTASDYFVGEQQFVENDANPWLGGSQAPVVIVEFTDFNCTGCAQTAQMIRDVVSEYGDYAKLIHRDFPVQQADNSVKLSEAARCANDQDKFWIMHDRLFAGQGLTADLLIESTALGISLDMDQFYQCLNDHKYKADVIKDYQDGVEAGVRAAPTYFFNGYKFEGALTLDNVYDIMDVLLPGLFELEAEAEVQ